MDTKDFIEKAGQAIDVAGVAVIVIGALVATCMFGYRIVRRHEPHETYQRYRRGLGRAILLGLEFLVAADIIRSVAISPTFAGVGVLAVIVLVRTFLSFSLEVELEGRWPWQRGYRAAATARPPASPPNGDGDRGDHQAVAADPAAGEPGERSRDGDG